MSERDDEDVFAQKAISPNMPNFDKDPNVDTVYQLYTKSRADLKEYSEEALWEFESHFEFGLNDIIQPCGYTEAVIWSFFADYRKNGDIADLVGLLKDYPVYGIPEISDELIKLLEKTRIKPVPKKVYEAERLHENVRRAFGRIDPERGQADNAYAEIAAEFKITFENAKTIIKRARKNGWDGVMDEGLKINKGSSSDNE